MGKFTTRKRPNEKDFEALVRDSFEAGWAANHLSSKKWDNKCYYRERKAENAGTRRTPPPQQTPEPNVLCEAPSSTLRIPSFEPRMDRMHQFYQCKRSAARYFSTYRVVSNKPLCLATRSTTSSANIRVQGFCVSGSYKN
ncbi:hypothetical protein BJV82DRAFT_583896 [Fennellomyces sp. T-0311]|nr:hypothetical protein BJV82DRAFT_583896 [Fennellomyces sp. T-0311]